LSQSQYSLFKSVPDTLSIPFDQRPLTSIELNIDAIGGSSIAQLLTFLIGNRTTYITLYHCYNMDDALVVLTTLVDVIHERIPRDTRRPPTPNNPRSHIYPPRCCVALREWNMTTTPSLAYDNNNNTANHTVAAIHEESKSITKEIWQQIDRLLVDDKHVTSLSETNMTFHDDGTVTEEACQLCHVEFRVLGTFLNDIRKRYRNTPTHFCVGETEGA
jgi:hypothetical protein